MSFTPISTQEEFDEAIKTRLQREAEKYSEKISALETDIQDKEKVIQTLTQTKADLEEVNKGFEEKIKGFEADIADRDAKIKGYETNSAKMRIAREVGLPDELASRLSGDDEEAMKKDAESLAAIIKKDGSAPPMKSTEPSGEGEKNNADAAYKSLLHDLKGEDE